MPRAEPTVPLSPSPTQAETVVTLGMLSLALLRSRTTTHMHTANSDTRLSEQHLHSRCRGRHLWVRSPTLGGDCTSGRLPLLLVLLISSVGPLVLVRPHVFV